MLVWTAEGTYFSTSDSGTIGSSLIARPIPSFWWEWAWGQGWSYSYPPSSGQTHQRSLLVCFLTTPCMTLLMNAQILQQPVIWNTTIICNCKAKINEPARVYETK